MYTDSEVFLLNWDLELLHTFMYVEPFEHFDLDPDPTLNQFYFVIFLLTPSLNRNTLKI